MTQSPASGGQDFLDHSSKDPLTSEPDTVAHHNHASTGDNGQDEGYGQSRSDASGLQDTTITPPEPTVRPISTCPTLWAMTNLVALSKGSGCYSVSKPQSLPEDFDDLWDCLRGKGPQFLALDMCYDLDAHLKREIKRLSLDCIDAHVKDLLAKVKTKSGRSFKQITPKTTPDSGTHLVETLCWDAKRGPLDPKAQVLEDCCWVMKRLGLDPDLRESDLVKTPEMLLALALGLALAQIGAVVPPHTPILGVYNDIVDQHCAVTNHLPPPRRPPPPPRHPQLPPITPLFTALGMLVLSQALWMIPICLAIHCLATAKSR